MLFHNSTDTVGLAVFVGFGIVFLIWVVFLVSLFIFKLVKVYQNLSRNDLLIDIITKITVLSIISLISAIIYFIMLIIASKMKDNKHIQMARDLIQLINIYLNFLCVLFSYNCFDNYYHNLCGKTNATCVNIWYRIARGNNQAHATNRTSAIV